MQIPSTDFGITPGISPKTPGVTQLQTVTTVTNSTNTCLMAMQQKQGKQEAFAAVKHILHNYRTVSTGSERNQMEAGVTATPFHDVSESYISHIALACCKLHTKRPISTAGQIKPSEASIDMQSDITPLYMAQMVLTQGTNVYIDGLT